MKNVSIMIGLETHVQLATKSKLFCACSAKAAKEPNENTCEICLGFPGSKPTLNKKALEKAIELALLMRCKINEQSRFARKIYFYPDLPKGFQITQYDEPLAVKGEFAIETAGKKKTINITRVHIEEDPGKMEYVGGHIGNAQSVLVDYNRSCIPLCEVVTEPDFESIEEAITYVKKLSHLLAYLDLIDSSQEGIMRTDANISIEGGARVELKNISGSEAIERALKAELNRQIFLRAQGKKAERETRTYSEETGTTILLRKKEYEEEYGYIREPDLLPLIVSKELVEEIKKHVKKLPEQVEQEIIAKHKLPKQIAHQLAFKRGLYEYYFSCLERFDDANTLAKWLVGDFLKCANWHNFEIEQCPREEKFLELLNAIKTKKITEREAKELIKKMFDDPFSFTIKKEKIDIQSIIETIIKENPAAIAKIKAGDEKAINFLLGQVLRKISFKGDPKEIREKILKKLKTEEAFGMAKNAGSFVRDKKTREF